MMDNTTPSDDESNDNYCYISDNASHWDGDTMFAVVRDDPHDSTMVTAVYDDRDAATAAACELTGDGVTGTVNIVPAHGTDSDDDSNEGEM